MTTHFIKLTRFVLAFVCFSYSVRAQESIVLQDSLKNMDNFYDLSKLLYWGGNTEIKSAFIQGPMLDDYGNLNESVYLDSQVFSNNGYSNPTHLRTSSCFDYKLPIQEREGKTYKIEWDAMWTQQSTWGEGGRLVVTLLYDYHQYPVFGSIDSVDMEHPFGRPAYNVRILNPSSLPPYLSGSSGAFMTYGGGHDSLGEIEKAYSKEEEKYLWWLPGFTSEPGGKAPGLLPAYPGSPTNKKNGNIIVYPNHWTHFEWLIEPERISLWYRFAEQPDANKQLFFFMETPSDEDTVEVLRKINEAHSETVSGLPLMYRYFDHFDALRFYFRGSFQTYLSNIKITSTPIETLAFQKAQPNVEAWDFSGKIPVPVGFETPYNLAVFDLSGRSLATQNLNPTDEAPYINLPEGIYIVVAHNEDKMMSKRFALR